ncbi:MAG: small subunit ribosomal protein S3 [bacterium]
MGQKVNPIGLRLGITKSWASNWYSEKSYKDDLLQDLRIKEYVQKNLKHAGIARVEVAKAAKSLKVVIFAARPGIIIGRKGEEAEKVKQSLARLVNNKDLVVNIKEVKRPETNAQLVANNVALQLERRVAYRRVIKKTMQNLTRFNVTGAKIMVSGRLNGAEMARTEWIREGRVPLHTLKADIDYATAESLTTYGIIGVKVWVYKENQQASGGQSRRRKMKRDR